MEGDGFHGARSQRHEAKPGGTGPPPAPETRRGRGGASGLGWWRSIRAGLLAFGFILLIRVLDPLGLEQVLFGRTAEITSRVLAVFYDPLHGDFGWYPATGQDRITVLLIDDATLAQMNQGWPPDFATYATILRHVHEYGPKSVFLDVVLWRERGAQGSATRLAALIRAMRDGSGAEGLARHAVPVLLGDRFHSDAPARECPGTEGSAPRALPQGDVLAPLACAATAVVPIAWRPIIGGYPADVPAPGCSADWPSAAFALDAIDRNPAWRPECGAAAPKADPAKPLFIVWGAAVSARMAAEPYGEDCPYRRGHLAWYTKIEVFVRAVFIGLDRRLSGGSECFHTETLRLSDLFSSSEHAETLRRQLLTNRHVLIGAKSEAARDFVYSPENGWVPGVYVHAMALDNLFVARARAAGPDHAGGQPGYHEADAARLFGAPLDVWETAFILGVAVFLGRLADTALHARTAGRCGALCRWLVAHRRTRNLLNFLLTLGILFVFVRLFDTPPTLWLGMLLSLCLIEPLLHLGSGGSGEDEGAEHDQQIKEHAP